MQNIILPNHLAVIIDGNRRWAKKHGKQLWEGHRYGIENLEKFLNWCFDLNLHQVSVYVLSTENLNRSKREVEELFRLAKEAFKRYEKEGSFLDKYEIKVKFAGDFKKLPKDLVEIINKVMKRTAKYQKKVLNILIAYGGRFEITQAMKKIAKKILESGRIEITEKDIEKNLLVNEPVDLVIRTGGYNRLSNLMIWQTAYAELYITKTLWPDFSKKEFMKAIKWYSSIKRNFGR